MIEIQGKYCLARVFTDICEESARGQIRQLADMPISEGERLRMMPDVHAGMGCTVGTTMTVTSGRVIPSLVGVDIGCGMLACRLKEKRVELQRLDKVIKEKTAYGGKVRGSLHKHLADDELSGLACRDKINYSWAASSFASLGGGNHFIELDRDEDGSLLLVIHSGSRRLGVEVANYYQNVAFEQARDRGEDTPKILSALEGQAFEDYLHDLEIVTAFADASRRAIAYDIMKEMKLHETESFTTVHNYIDQKRMILRKGAVSAEKDEIFLVPINMRDGSFICKGKGNEDWNYSAPHGAGRLMSRSDARESFTLSEYKKQMKGIYSSSVSSETLDECPMAYKSIESIRENIGDTCEIISTVRPIYNFKAGNE